jgi:predicted ATPase
LFSLGRFADAAAALDEGIAIDDAVAAWDNPAHLRLYTERAGVACRLFSARALWFLGFPDRALATVEAGLALADRLAHPYSLAFALTWAAVLHAFRRELEAALRRADAAIGIAREHRMPLWRAQATMCRGFALVGHGRCEEGITDLRTGLADWNGIGARFMETQWLGLTAEAHIRVRQFDDALAALDRATETATATAECYYQAELHRLRGIVLAQTHREAEAALWLQQAIDTAKGQQARSLELRAAATLARVWQGHGRRAEAHDLLSPVYGWFTEGFDTADLRDAKALLDELRWTPSRWVRPREAEPHQR